jgi:DNA-binding NarL/FixJ family response regulator
MACVIAFMDDLMFLSRVREAAKAAGVEVRSARKLPDLLAAAPEARLVLVDLDSQRLPTADALRALKADAALAGIPVVGFFSHVHVERARDAEAAGCSRVLARSAFVKELPDLLRAAS